MKISQIQLKAQESLKNGMGFLEASEVYGLSLALYKKLGGRPEIKYINSSKNPFLDIFCGDELVEPCATNAKIDEDLVLGTVLGDGHIALPPGGVTTNLMVGHCWEQIGYLKMKYELLKPYSSVVKICRPDSIDKVTDGPQSDFSVHLRTRSSKLINPFYELFYTEVRPDKSNPHKDILKQGIIEKMTWKAFAFWLMDDGSKRSSHPGNIDVVFKKHPWYSLSGVNAFINGLSDNLGIHLYVNEDQDTFTIYFKKESYDKALTNLTPHFWPDLHYKLNVMPELCGSNYRDFQWFKDWDLKREGLNHPFLAEFDIHKYRECKEERLKQRFLRNYYSQCKVRGFPWGRLSEEEREQEWSKILKSEVNIEGKCVRVDTKLNRLPNHFSPYRFKVPVDNLPSPYEVFHNKGKMVEILRKRVDLDTGITQDRIRNVLCSWNGRAAGQFNPAYVRHFIDLYCEGKDVLDPCAGWTGRMFGSVSMGKNYYGIEPSSYAVPQLLEAREWLLKHKPGVGVDVIKGVAEEDQSYGGKEFDFAITSTPYFNKEKYSDELTQSYRKYPTASEWLGGFLRPLIENVYNHLKTDCYFVLNIDDHGGYPLCVSAIQYAIKSGFIFEDTVWGHVGSRSAKKAKSLDNFLILRKK